MTIIPREFAIQPACWENAMNRAKKAELLQIPAEVVLTPGKSNCNVHTRVWINGKWIVLPGDRLIPISELKKL